MFIWCFCLFIYSYLIISTVSHIFRKLFNYYFTFCLIVKDMLLFHIRLLDRILAAQFENDYITGETDCCFCHESG